ncbi:MAG: two-component sensor histidine kinase, partial [Gammaproteobacteria bacterium]|nr:two-component sensor histidine kinase [Gammaproteobacteria bacterium]
MSKRFSLNQRILFSAALLLVLFISITAAALNRAHFRSTQQALHDTLDTQL